MTFDYGWTEFFKQEITKPYFKELGASVYIGREEDRQIYPEEGKTFNAFKLTQHSDLKVVILGQDPYYQAGMEQGLAYSVPAGVPIPSVLGNIFKEIERDLGVVPPKSGDLTGWAEKGVFLLNCVLTVEKNKPGSHRSWGWEQFTDNAIKYLSDTRRGLIFALWGDEAQRKSLFINPDKHTILKTSHPSPGTFEQGFYGCGHFSQINKECKIWA